MARSCDLVVQSRKSNPSFQWQWSIISRRHLVTRSSMLGSDCELTLPSVPSPFPRQEAIDVCSPCCQPLFFHFTCDARHKKAMKVMDAPSGASMIMHDSFLLYNRTLRAVSAQSSEGLFAQGSSIRQCKRTNLVEIQVMSILRDGAAQTPSERLNSTLHHTATSHGAIVVE